MAPSTRPQNDGRLEAPGLGYSKTSRRQYHSCDQCRKSRRACDAATVHVTSFPLECGGNPQSPISSNDACTNCAKTSKKCTCSWLDTVPCPKVSRGSAYERPRLTLMSLRMAPTPLRQSSVHVVTTVRQRVVDFHDQRCSMHRRISCTVQTLLLTNSKAWDIHVSLRIRPDLGMRTDISKRSTGADRSIQPRKLRARPFTASPPGPTMLVMPALVVRGATTAPRLHPLQVVNPRRVGRMGQGVALDAEWLLRSRTPSMRTHARNLHPS